MSRSFFVPETLQTSAMDCGPAALKSLLGGLGVAVNYERLREACRTGADGTSIDAIEDLCVGLGLEAFQEMAPVADALAVLEARCPCIVVVKGSGGAPHFIVVWRVLGSMVQIMDPGRGRQWISKESLQRDLHVHSQAFDDRSFREWFVTTEWKNTLHQRLRRLGAPRDFAAFALPARDLGALDGAARLVERLVAQGALPRGDRWAAVLELTRVSLASAPGPVPPALAGTAQDLDGNFAARGAVFLVVRRRAAGNADHRPPAAPALRQVLGSDGPSPLAVLVSHVTKDGRRLLGLMVIVATMLAALALAEMLLLRAAFNADTLLSLPQQRLGGTLLYAGLIAVLLVLETTLGFGVVRLGQSLELRMRLALLQKLPRLPNRYFRSRPMSDVTHRSQGLFEVRPLPSMIVSLTKLCLDMLVTLAALCILHPHGAPLTLLALLFGLVAPVVALRFRRQVEQRVQSHASELGQLYLDVLLGLVPLRNHGGQPAVRSKQQDHLVSWRQESDRAMRMLSLTEAVQSIGVMAAVVLVLVSYLRAESTQSGLVLVAFWALRLPLQARALSSALQRIPRALASLARVVEPLTAAETAPDDELGDEQTMVLAQRRGIALRFRDVKVVLGTHEVLSNVSLDIAAGARVAVVGSSGAGKSSLLAVLLGLVDRSAGDVIADGRSIERYDLGRLRRETVWIDPSVQLWNRSLLDNVRFGNPGGARQALEPVLDEVQLGDLLERLPQGLSTELGESGARVSGGEGQRVRLARALLRRGARLVLLDEAFRGLDRGARRKLSRSVRARVGQATVIEVTHDVSDTTDFDRILVIEDGRLVEHDTPAALLARHGSRYAALVEADRAVQEDVWGAKHWKRLVVDGAAVVTHERIHEEQREQAEVG